MHPSGNAFPKVYSELTLTRCIFLFFFASSCSTRRGMERDDVLRGGRPGGERVRAREKERARANEPGRVRESERARERESERARERESERAKRRESELYRALYVHNGTGKESARPFLRATHTLVLNAFFLKRNHNRA